MITLHMLAESVHFKHIVCVLNVYVGNFLTDSRTVASLYKWNITAALNWFSNTEQGGQVGQGGGISAVFSSTKFSSKAVLHATSFTATTTTIICRQPQLVHLHGALLPDILHSSQELTQCCLLQ